MVKRYVGRCNNVVTIYIVFVVITKAVDDIPTEPDDPISCVTLLLLVGKVMFANTGITADPLSLSVLNKQQRNTLQMLQCHIINM